MRGLTILAIVLGLGRAAFAFDPSGPQLNPIRGSGNLGGAPDAPRPETAPAAVRPTDYFAINGAVWCRAADGRAYVWQNRRWVAGDMPQLHTALKPVIPDYTARPAVNPARRYSRNPEAIISHPQDSEEHGLQGNPFFGGGRGQFSS